MIFQKSPLTPQLSDYFLWTCQATTKDNKLIMAFFFVKIISLSKPSGSISNTMQYLHVLELTSDATNENETCYSP